MSETCPKCGAEATPETRCYVCGSGHPSGYGTWYESEGCLRRQLAAMTAERDIYRADATHSKKCHDLCMAVRLALARAEKAEAACAAMVEALEFYADKSNWDWRYTVAAGEYESEVCMYGQVERILDGNDHGWLIAQKAIGHPNPGQALLDRLKELEAVVAKLRPADKADENGWRYDPKFLKEIERLACTEYGDDAANLCWEDIELALRYGFKVASTREAAEAAKEKRKAKQ